MNKNNILFDKSPIYTVESYVGYGINHFDELTRDELKNEIDKMDKKIDGLYNEIRNLNKRAPSFVIQEEIRNAVYYRDKLQKEYKNRTDKMDEEIKEKRTYKKPSIEDDDLE